MSASPVRLSDVIVVGGGIVGCATAYFLARRGAAVTVLERDRIGGEQSSRAWGFIRQQGRHPAEIPLAALASQLWRGLEQELQADLEYVRDGILVTAATEDDVNRLDAALKVTRGQGLAARMLTGAETAALAPGSAASWRAGLLTPEDGHAEPIKATLAFAAAARARGTTILENTPVLAIETAGGAVCGVATPQGRHAAAAIVCAAGIGTAPLLRPAGVALPIKVMRAPVSQTSRAAPAMTVPFWCPHVAFRPKRDGSFYVGNGYREIDGEFDVTLEAFRDLPKFVPTLMANWRVIRLRFGRAFADDLIARLSRRTAETGSEPPVNARLVARNMQCFHAVFPAMARLGLARSWAGRIDVTPDLIPILGPVGRPAGLYVAAGFNGHGFALAPAVGQVMADLVREGRAPLDLRSFRHTRFAEGEGRPHPGTL